MDFALTILHVFVLFYHSGQPFFGLHLFPVQIVNPLNDRWNLLELCNPSRQGGEIKTAFIYVKILLFPMRFGAGKYACGNIQESRKVIM